MDYYYPKLNKKMFLIRTAFLVLVLFFSTGPASGIVPTGTDIGALQFDGIIELNAPYFQTHVLLFVRYWVSPEFYHASIVWAEPHVGSLNFSTYPITTVIDSNEQSFAITNEVLSKDNSVFSKPLGERDVFRFMFNDYPIGNIRFAESDALASRIYANDFNRQAEQTDKGVQTIEISNTTDKNKAKREAAKLDIQIDDGRLNILNLLDNKDRLVKAIEYQYADQNSPFLHRQNITLPQRPLTVGYKGRGATITINGKKQTIKEFEIPHHAGSRKCTVDYELKKIAGKTLALPVRMVVYDGLDNDILRSSRLMNFEPAETDEEKIKKAADSFGSFNDDEWKTREMLLKYWMKNPAQIEDKDLAILRRLQTHFEQITATDKTAGEKLKRINMLLQLDWILGDGEQLIKHFTRYLALLTENNLNQMVLVGGQYAIETTFRWGYFDAADQLMEKWIDAAIAVNDEQAVLSFAQSVIKKDRFRTTVCLLEKSLAASRNKGQNRFEAKSLKCIALFGLCNALQNPKTLTGRRKAQAIWVSRSTNADQLKTALRQSGDNAIKAFAGLKNPTPEQTELKKQLDAISEKVSLDKNDKN